MSYHNSEASLCFWLRRKKADLLPPKQVICDPWCGKTHGERNQYISENQEGVCGLTHICKTRGCLNRCHYAKLPHYITQKINNYKIICHQIARFNIRLAIKSGFFRGLLAVSFIFFLLFHKKMLFLQSGMLYSDGFAFQRLAWRCISLVLWAHAVPLVRIPFTRGGGWANDGRKHNRKAFTWRSVLDELKSRKFLNPVMDKATVDVPVWILSQPMM